MIFSIFVFLILFDHIADFRIYDSRIYDFHSYDFRVLGCHLADWIHHTGREQRAREKG